MKQNLNQQYIIAATLYVHEIDATNIVEMKIILLI